MRKAQQRFLLTTTAAMALSLAGSALASGTASATLTNSGGTVSITDNPAGGVGTPYASGQNIDVVVNANTALNSTTLAAAGINGSPQITIEECLAVGGSAPSTPVGNCDGATAQVSANLNADGSLLYTTAAGGGPYPVYQLPNAHLFESKTHLPACGLAPNYCILYIGTDPTSGTAPHVYSAPFQVQTTDANSTGTVNPGDGTPESPLAIALPIAGVVAAGGAYFMFGRRRRQRVA